MAFELKEKHVHIAIMVILAISLILLAITYAKKAKEGYASVASNMSAYNGGMMVSGPNAPYHDLINLSNDYYQFVDADGNYQNAFVGLINQSVAEAPAETAYNQSFRVPPEDQGY